MPLKPDSLTHCYSNPLMVNYRSQKFLDLLAPTPYANVTRLSPAFCVRVWLCETSMRFGLETAHNRTTGKLPLANSKVRYSVHMTLSNLL